MDQENRFAVLIDADNISEKYINIIMNETTAAGIATYKRIYGDFTNPRMNSWKSVLLDNSIIPMQQYGYTTGKSATDSAMIIDAMDILYSGNVDGFCIVSSDSDFTRLVARLREAGKTVIGMGESKTPKPFISACNSFKYLDILFANEQQAAKAASESRKNKKTSPKSAKDSKEAKEPASGKKAKTKVKDSAPVTAKENTPLPQTSLGTISSAVISVMDEGSDEDGWMLVADVGNQLAKRFPDFDVRNYGFKKLSSFLESLPGFEVRKTRSTGSRNSNIVHVRYTES